VKEELYDAIVDKLFETIGFKCQPSEIETLAEEIVDLVREALTEELY